MVCRARLIIGLFAIHLLARGAPPPAEVGPSGPVSRKPPAVYTDRLAALLTPLKTVMARRGDFSAKGQDGILLLDESLIYTDDKGSRILVYHNIEEALTESGVRSLADDTHSYRTADQRIHLVLARTILADGRELPVEDRAAFLESPQSDAGDSVYGDRGQLRLIFSGITPGAVRESIIVVEEDSPRIPGHFSTHEYWGAFWPKREERTVVLMPDSVASRVKVTNVGSGVPSPVKEKWRQGWSMWTWMKEKQTPQRYEEGRPPVDQIGPATMVTTLPDWETFGAWYRGLLRERSTLDATLKKLAVDWTKDAKTPHEKLDAVISHVSRDLRYTGLEFGLGGLQPRTAEEIWRTGYGDCKDKANLAALLLRDLGIEANLVLLQTEHAGLIEKRCPDFRHFNHAIVVATIDGAHIFSDPTIRYGKPGMLSAPDSDRDVLIVKKDSVEWARTPVFPKGEVHYRVDAALDTDGAVEGWLEMISTGYFQAQYQSYYERLGREEMQRDLQELLTSLLPGSRLIDAQKSKLGSETLWRCFFSIPSQDGDDAERRSLYFPAGSPVMLSMQEEETRETPRFLWPLIWRVSGKISLPPGWQIQEVPARFDLHTEPYDVHASWTVKDGICLPAFEAKVTSSLLKPAFHPAVWRGTQSLQSWLRKPLRMIRGGSAAPVTSDATNLDKMPLMPSGEGQLTLVEQRYPATGNRTIRRAALKKTIEYFPDDPATLFAARGKLALLDWDEDKPDEALRSLRELTANPSPKVSEEVVWWARYMTGLVLKDTKKYQEALQEFEPIVARTSLSPYRRSWACFHTSATLSKLKQPAKALQLAREGLVFYDTESSPSLLAQYANLLFEAQKQSELKKEVTALIEAMGPKAAPALVRLAELGSAWAQDGHSAWTAEAVALLESLPSDIQTEDVTAALADAKKTIATVGAAADLQKELQAWLATHQDSYVLVPPADGWPATLELCSQAYGKADEAQDSHLGSRLAIRSITAYPPDAEFSSRLWKAAAHVENHERSQKPAAISPLLQLLFKLAARLPKSDDPYFEMRFLEARTHERRFQDWKAASAIYEETIADKAMPESYLPSALTRLADCYQELADWPHTVATLSSMEAVKQYASAGDGLARAAHLRLEMGEPDEALRLLRVVAGSREFALKHSAMPDILGNFLDLTKNEKNTRTKWQPSPSWWPQWQKLQSALGIDDKPIEPLLVNAENAGAIIQQALQNKDRAAAGRILRQIAHCARWHSDSVTNLAWLCVFKIPSLHPEQHQSLLGFVLALMADFEPVSDDQRRNRFMYITVSHMDRDEPEEALKYVHDYFKTYPSDENTITFLMTRLWGSLALNMKGEQSKAAAALEHTLESKELRGDRVNSVINLADLYRSAGDTAKEVSLLKTALEHSAIASDPQNTKTLKHRLEQLTVGAGYSQAVRQWIAKQAPPWYDYAKPKDLKEFGDPENLYSTLQDTYDRRKPAENIKAFLLAASNGTSSADQIDEWWARALSLLLIIQPGPESQLRASIDRLLDDSEAPNSFKDTTLRVAYLHAGAFEETDLMKHWREKFSASLLSPFSRDRMEIVDTVLAVNLDKPQAFADAVQAQVKKRDAGLLNFMVSRLANRAAEHGKLDALQAITETLTKARKDATVDSSAIRSLRLEVTRTLSATRRLLPIENALAELVLKHPAAQPRPGSQVPRLVGHVAAAMLTSRQYMDWIHAQCRLGKRPSGDLGPWHSYLRACADAGTTPTLELRRQLIDATVRLAIDDETRADIVGIAASGVDLDSPPERDYLTETLKPWRDATAMPRTYANIRLLEAHTAHRLGQDFDLQSLNSLEGDRVKARLLDLRLTIALQSGNRAAVSAALDKLGSDAMLQSNNIIRIIHALKLCDRKDELELALETAAERLYDSTLSSWTGNDFDDAIETLNLAEELQQPASVSAAWLKFVHQAYPERHHQLMVAMDAARLKKDWPAALAAASEAVEKFPAFYSNYWNKAQALWQLGRKDEVIEPLRIYTQYCHDEDNYSAAVKLLKEAGK